jgi:hypothetical protein
MALSSQLLPGESHDDAPQARGTDKAPERYPRAALRWHGRLCREVDVSLEEAQATLAALVLMAGERKGNAAFALADLLSRRGLERLCETLVAWARTA